MMGVLRNVEFRSFEGLTGLALDVPGPLLSGGLCSELLARRNPRSWCGSKEANAGGNQLL